MRIYVFYCTKADSFCAKTNTFVDADFYRILKVNTLVPWFHLWFAG